MSILYLIPTVLFFIQSLNIYEIKGILRIFTLSLILFSIRDYIPFDIYFIPELLFILALFLYLNTYSLIIKFTHILLPFLLSVPLLLLSIINPYALINNLINSIIIFLILVTISLHWKGTYAYPFFFMLFSFISKFISEFLFINLSPIIVSFLFLCGIAWRVRS
ncbi:MAG: hypothetical protein CBR30_08975 [Dictyoglomus sp. NZ13-RE01]|nr:MAG: hypothetical protein CBR30_08975 [Dictyoglomus sp. NZ13-RE01]